MKITPVSVSVGATIAASVVTAIISKEPPYTILGVCLLAVIVQLVIFKLMDRVDWEIVSRFMPAQDGIDASEGGRSHNIILGLTYLPPSRIMFKPLTIEELRLAEGVPSLKVIQDQYQLLHGRWEQLDHAVIRRGAGKWPLVNVSDEAVYDEVVCVEIKKPALLFKQYEHAHADWRVVPASSKFVDRSWLKRWLRKSNTHPLTREEIDNPEPYNKKTTHYCLQEYHPLVYAQELREAADNIRKKLATSVVSGARVTPNVISTYREWVGSTFFGCAASIEAKRLEANQSEVGTQVGPPGFVI